MRINPDEEDQTMVAAFRKHVATMDNPPREFIKTNPKYNKRAKRWSARTSDWLMHLECFKFGWELFDDTDARKSQADILQNNDKVRRSHRYCFMDKSAKASQKASTGTTGRTRNNPNGEG